MSAAILPFRAPVAPVPTSTRFPESVVFGGAALQGDVCPIRLRVWDERYEAAPRFPDLILGGLDRDAIDALAVRVYECLEDEWDEPTDPTPGDAVCSAVDLMALELDDDELECLDLSGAEVVGVVLRDVVRELDGTPILDVLADHSRMLVIDVCLRPDGLIVAASREPITIRAIPLH